MDKKSIKPPHAPLFVPGNRPERFVKAAQSDADAIIIDLEDAVHADEKAAAQRNVLTHGITTKPVFVRINSRSSHWWCADVAVVAEADIDGVMVAKAETVDDITGIQQGAGKLLSAIPLIESAAAFANLRTLLSHPSVICAAFGTLDYALDIGCETSWEALLHARSILTLESRIAGLPAPIDGVTPQFNDDNLLRQETARARLHGYGGKLAIHPRQTSVIRKIFSPTDEEIKWANAILAASQGSSGAAQINGTMIDLPVIERAKRILRVV